MILEVKNIKKTYSDFQLDCSLNLQKGRITGLIGANGTGKTTIFKAILGLIRIESGTIRIFGKDINELEKKNKEDIAVILSERTFSGYLTIKQIAKIMELSYQSFQRKDFLEQCVSHNLPLNKMIKDFSTGMKAKMKLLLAVSYQAKLLILDEPTEGLDVIARDEMLTILRTYMENEERSILISSHISTDLENFCDDIYLINKGNIIFNEEMPALLDEYGFLKINEEQLKMIDPKYISYIRKDNYGYCCMTSEKKFYQENFSNLVIEKGSLDEVLMMVVKGEKRC
jgi:ABC-2 type transport system ATP-binding protein